MDRFDLRVEVPPVTVDDLTLPAAGESSGAVAARVAQARAIQRGRFAGHDGVSVNADAEGDLLEAIAALTQGAARLLADVAAKFRLSARAYHRVLRVARTIADLEGVGPVDKQHVAEAAGYRLAF
jgi:magnesium chelatase family protein